MRTKSLAIAAGALLAVLLLLQLLPVRRDNPPVLGDVEAPQPVKAVLRESCYDCHSNETRWPWYARVAPVSWWLVREVSEGRQALNFSSWRQLGADKQLEVLVKVREEILEGEMPPRLYVLGHRSAALEGAHREVLLGWLGDSGASSESAQGRDKE
ncbi:MAG: heme-binding domain-containing protein [Deltaproteobacteria bacterium]|nr:heme-binding domain-containing protein [Deltaproteobacteria bacterium]